MPGDGNRVSNSRNAGGPLLKSIMNRKDEPWQDREKQLEGSKVERVSKV